MAARKTTGTSSASKQKSAIVSAEIGKLNHGVDAIREQYKIEEEKQKLNYAAAKEENLMRTIRDITKNSNILSNLNATDKERIRAYLTGNIYSNSSNLINASKYLYLRSPIYYQIISKYSSMYCFDCRKIEPSYTFSNGLDNNALKQMDETLDFLDIVSLQNTIQGPLIDMWIQDVSFNLFFHDDKGCFFWPIDPSEAVIDSIYEIDGGYTLGFAIDMTKWKSQQRQSLIEFLGSPLSEMWNEFLQTGIKYVHVPAEYSFVLKKSLNNINVIIPPLLPYLNQLASLNDLTDAQSTADDLSFYRMIYLPLKTLNSAKNSDDFEITPDLAIQYFKIAADTAIPAGVSSAVIPGDELKTIDFSDNVTEDVNRVESSQQQILGAMSGMGALLNSNKAINNTELIKNALRAESSYALQNVLSEVEAWTNMQLALNVSAYCPVHYMPITIYTKDDYRKTLLESMQYGFSYRLAYGTLLGFTERQTMASLMFEQNILGLPDVMKFPLSSSYTSSGDSEVGEVGQGRPEKDSGELSPSGERSRNK